MKDDKKLTDAEREFEEYIKQPIPRVPKRKAVFAEVGPRMHAAVKAKPEKLRLVAEDEHGNAVIERPYRPPNPAVGKSIVPDGPHSAIGEVRWKPHNEGWDAPRIGNPSDWDQQFGRSSYPDANRVLSEYDPIMVFRRELGDE